MKAAIVDVTTGELLSKRHRIPTPQPATPRAVAKAFGQLVQDLNWEGAVGACFPTVIKDGKATTHGNLSPDWTGVQVDRLFESWCPNTTVWVANDAGLAGMAEMQLGVGKGRQGKVLMLTVGTGVGSALFHNGVLVPNTELGRIYNDKGQIYEQYIADSVRKKEDLSLKEWAGRFDLYLHHLDTILSPHLFIIGGGISKKYEKYHSYFTVPVPIVPAHFLNNAGIIGAALYAAAKAKVGAS